MSDDHDPKSGKPWMEADTQPLGLRSLRTPPPPPPWAKSPEATASVKTPESERKPADAKRSKEVEAILDALSYDRPAMPVQRAETDGDRSAAHRAPPREVPARVDTPAPEPPLVLSHSLVHEMRTPSPPPQTARPVAIDTRPAVVIRTPEEPLRLAPAPVTTVILARRRIRTLILAAPPTAVLVAVLVWGATRSGPKAPATGESPATKPGETATAATAPGALAPEVSPQASAAPPLPSVDVTALPAVTAAPRPTSSSAARDGRGARASKREGARVTAPAPSASEAPPIHTEFELQ